MGTKQIAILILVIGFLTGAGFFIKWYDQSRFDAGYAQCEVDQQKATDEKVKSETDALRIELAEVIKQKEKERVDAMELVKQLRSRSEVTDDEIKKVTVVSECTNLGSDFTRVFNRIIGSPPGPGDGLNRVNKGSDTKI